VWGAGLSVLPNDQGEVLGSRPIPVNSLRRRPSGQFGRRNIPPPGPQAFHEDPPGNGIHARRGPARGRALALRERPSQVALSRAVGSGVGPGPTQGGSGVDKKRAGRTFLLERRRRRSAPPKPPPMKKSSLLDGSLPRASPPCHPQRKSRSSCRAPPERHADRLLLRRRSVDRGP